MGELVELDVTKSVAENAKEYYDKSKKAKAKIEGLKKAIKETLELIEDAKREGVREEEGRKIKERRHRNWFEKFHWFHSSDGFLVLGGRDAKQNEVVVKKYLEEGDAYCHADIVGAPQVVVKANGKTVSDAAKGEAAVFAASYSKAWKNGASTCDVFFASPSQVSKSAPSGEYLGSGAFMVRGQREWRSGVKLVLGVGLVSVEGSKVLECAPLNALKAHGSVLCALKPGRTEKGEAARKILKAFKGELDGFGLDDLLSVLPNGGVEIVKT